MLYEIHMYSCVAMEYETTILAAQEHRQRQAASEHANGFLHVRGPTRRTWAAFQRGVSSLPARLRS